MDEEDLLLKAMCFLGMFVIIAYFALIYLDANAITTMDEVSVDFDRFGLND